MDQNISATSGVAAFEYPDFEERKRFVSVPLEVLLINREIMDPLVNDLSIIREEFLPKAHFEILN